MRRLLLYLILILSICSAEQLYGQYNKVYFYNVGRHFIIDNRYRDAIEMLNIMLKADEKAYEGYFLRGIAKYNLDDLLGAEMDFTEAIKHNPVFTTAYQYRAITRSRLGNYDDALNDFREAIELRPDLPDVYYSRGVTLLLNQQFDKAIKDFDMFINQEDKVVDAYINRGVAYLMLKDTTRAMENYNKAITTNRENPNGYSRLGTIYMAQKRYDDAISEFDKAISYDSLHVQSFFNRAIAYSYTNRPLQSIDDFSHIISIDSTNSLAYFNRALVRSQTGDYNRALEDYDNVILYSPKNVLVYYNRGGLHYQLGNLQASLHDYTKAIDLYPDFANAYLNRAKVRYLLKDVKGSKSDKTIAQRKINEYRAKLSDSTFSVYADTSRHFNELLSFDTKASSFDNLSSREADITMLPMFKFTILEQDSVQSIKVDRYFLQRAEDFCRIMESGVCVKITMSNKDSNLQPDSLVALDRIVANELAAQARPSWQSLFKRGLTQSLIKQYTNALNSYTQAIDMNPSNPFLYMNRGTTRAEMIEFVSSIDNTYHRLTIEKDPANKLKRGSNRTYDYDDAIGDMNKAAKLFPEYAYIYYNRANLYCLSGRMPEALEDYTRAIELNPSFAEAYYNRGLLQIYLKDTRKGCLDISKAGELGIVQAYQVLKIYSTNN